MTNQRVKKRRNRFAVAVLQGVGMYMVGYFPALSWGNPMIAIGMTSLMMILVASRFTSVRQGFIRGLILGALAGMAIYGGLNARLMSIIHAREQAAQPQQVASAEGNDDVRDSSPHDTAAQPDDTPPANDDAPQDAATEPLGDETGPADDDTGNELLAAGDDAPAQPADNAPAVVPFPQENRDYYEKLRRGLPYYTVPPPIVICTVIGMIFAHLATRRRKKTQQMWQ